MTPVELRLQNFLSYGEHVPPLDFEAFSVACISGGNGQGKSSLLEAMTWALWGQARKGASSTKPDADLLRKGSQRMLVEFTFDHEGQRYRVRRAYNVSGSGKTSRPELELLARDGDAYRPLTGGSVAETQRLLDALLRIDFDTFVNASFLLQGRSDEFTRKRPNERKEVLARILDLGRYEVLEERARAREATARTALDAAERDLARIGADLDTRADTETARDAARALEEDARARRAAADAARDAARRALDALADEARRAEDFHARLARADEDRARLLAERADVDARTHAAEALLERRADIEAAKERFDALETELRALTEKSAQFLGLRQQEIALEADLQRRLSEHERQRATLEADRRSEAGRLADLEAEGAARAALQAEVDAVRAQSAAFAQMEDARLRRLALLDERRGLEADLAAARRTLDADAERLRARLEDLDARRERRRDVQAQADALRERALSLEAARQTLSDLERDGRRQAEIVAQRTPERDHAAAEALSLQARLDRLHSAEEGTCPTCGTDLTPEHRAHVATDLGAQVRAKQEQANRLTRQVEQETARRDDLRDRFKQQREAVSALETDERLFQRLSQEVRGFGSIEEERAAAQGGLGEIQAVLEAGAFAPEVRARLGENEREGKALGFDATRHEALRRDAARLDTLAHRLADLDARLDGLADLRTRVAGLDARLDELRRQHDDGRIFGDLLQRRDALRARIAALDFDGVRFETVQAEHERLRAVPSEYAALLSAREQRADHLARRAALTEGIARLDSDRSILQRDLDALAGLDARREAATQSLALTEATVAEAVVAHEHARDEVARLDLRVQQLAALAAHAADADAAARVARDEAALYKHLRTAFSRRGIPSLIIEETLPEIEENANDLLSRLTDGRMHLQLRSLRDKKTGGTAETLDIVLSDEMGGERPYETFSGGEAFRVNFALRVALSQLLARRSGVSVRTLVVDEGFGTQDPQGLQALVEAIRSIQDQFDKILIVTHLDELKEAFPVRIEVRKDPTTGSTFEVVGA